jgi:hypothetical protein
MSHIWLAILISAFPTAHSTLGEHAESVTQDAAQLKGRQLKVSSRPQFTVHEMTTDGHRVKEFVNANGVVFAVSWRGVSRPNLQTLFGSYHRDYKEAEARQPRELGRKRSSTVKGARVVVHQEGHMRDLRGLALVPDLMPPGVRPEDLQ